MAEAIAWKNAAFVSCTVNLDQDQQQYPSTLFRNAKEYYRLIVSNANIDRRMLSYCLETQEYINFKGYCVKWMHRSNSTIQAYRLRGEKLNYNSCTSLLLRKSQNLLFLAPEVQWALKIYRVCSIYVFFKYFEPCPYLVCHVTTIENV